MSRAQSPAAASATMGLPDVVESLIQRFRITDNAHFHGRPLDRLGRVVWDESEKIAMMAHLARHQLGPDTAEKHRLGELATRILGPLEGREELHIAIRPRLARSLKTLLAKLANEGHVHVDATRGVRWEPHTGAWAAEGWAGDKTPDDVEVGSDVVQQEHDSRTPTVIDASGSIIDASDSIIDASDSIIDASESIIDASDSTVIFVTDPASPSAERAHRLHQQRQARAETVSEGGLTDSVQEDVLPAPRKYQRPRAETVSEGGLTDLVQEVVPGPRISRQPVPALDPPLMTPADRHQAPPKVHMYVPTTPPSRTGSSGILATPPSSRARRGNRVTIDPRLAQSITAYTSLCSPRTPSRTRTPLTPPATPRTPSQSDRARQMAQLSSSRPSRRLTPMAPTRPTPQRPRPAQRHGRVPNLDAAIHPPTPPPPPSKALGLPVVVPDKHPAVTAWLFPPAPPPNNRLSKHRRGLELLSVIQCAYAELPTLMAVSLYMSAEHARRLRLLRTQPRRLGQQQRAEQAAGTLRRAAGEARACIRRAAEAIAALDELCGVPAGPPVHLAIMASTLGVLAGEGGEGEPCIVDCCVGRLGGFS
ncbi:hypothetical protein CONLIGDRAFT_675164 [Coniochaeta ligniaria NRRL 30616]|uniref:Uncharacterized protein n=1 Tax=Coniochaeta ligniaria NRRL 30616 TaxID=1408157 RepID=A0A1J7J413_9PEZI|nr:hypothetical protein CONLIGDRAFT_675164 [Coniochaeta ligniaria NRRL 30616]